jgi:hypothetical protein
VITLGRGSHLRSIKAQVNLVNFQKHEFKERKLIESFMLELEAKRGLEENKLASKGSKSKLIIFHSKSSIQAST